MRRQTDIATAREVDGGEIKRLSEETLLQRRRDELVDLVAVDARETERDYRFIAGERRWVEERLEQRNVRECAREIAIDVRIRDLERLGQHRVAEAEHGLAELEADAHVDVGRIGDELRQRAVERADILVDCDVVVF